MKTALTLLLLLTFSTPAFAEGLNLYPKGRAAYQSRFEANSERYEIDKRSYIDNLYEYKGEGNAAPSSREKMLPEADLDAYINGTADLNGQPKTSSPPAATPPNE